MFFVNKKNIRNIFRGLTTKRRMWVGVCGWCIYNGGTVVKRRHHVSRLIVN